MSWWALPCPSSGLVLTFLVAVSGPQPPCPQLDPRVTEALSISHKQGDQDGTAMTDILTPYFCPLEQWSPNFWSPGTGFGEDSFSTAGIGGWFRR